MPIFELPKLSEAEKRLNEIICKTYDMEHQASKDWVAIQFALEEYKKMVFEIDMPYIHQWMRDETNRIIGVMVAVKLENNSICVGWSKRHEKDKVVFDKIFSLRIAVERAMKGSKVRIRHGHETHLVREQYVKFAHRAQKYFKGCPLASVAGDKESIEQIKVLTPIL